MADRAEFELDISDMTRLVASQLQPIMRRGSRILVEEIKARIQLQAEHSEPGEFPASPTREYYDSWHDTPAFIFDDAVVSWAESDSRQNDGFPTVLALDHGRGDIAPRPHIDAAILAATPRIEALIRRAERDLGDG